MSACRTARRVFFRICSILSALLPGKARQQCAEDRADPEEHTACRAASGHTQCTNEKGRLAVLPVDPLCAGTIGKTAGGQADWQQQNLAFIPPPLETARQ